MSDYGRSITDDGCFERFHYASVRGDHDGVERNGWSRAEIKPTVISSDDTRDFLRHDGGTVINGCAS